MGPAIDLGSALHGSAREDLSTSLAKGMHERKKVWDFCKEKARKVLPMSRSLTTAENHSELGRAAYLVILQGSKKSLLSKRPNKLRFVICVLVKASNCTVL